MLMEFDQTTLAYMTAALEHVCKKIPPDKDTPELRKRIANQMIALARSKKCTIVDLQSAGLETLRAFERESRPQFLGALINWLKLPKRIVG